MNHDWTLYVLLFAFAAMVMLRLDRLGKQIEAVHHSILLEVPLDEEARAELTRERQFMKKEERKAAWQFWIFWGVVGAAGLIWFAVKNS